MTAPPAAVPASKTVRYIYGGMIGGVLLFGVVGPIAFKAKVAGSGALRDSVLRILLGLSLAASALAVLLRRRVPKRSADESADLFWSTAGSRALVMWTAVEVAGLIAAIAYALSGSLSALVVAVVAVVVFFALNPGYIERP